MRFTLSWLKEYLDTKATIDEIASALIACGLEVEDIEDRQKDLSDFIVAEIIAADKHPNADRLKVCEVFDGKETLQIVCGAPNARAGIKVVLARIGTIIPNGNFAIKQTKIRGVESNGMLCSAEELLLKDTQDGIIELPQDSTVGEKIIDVFGLSEVIFDISITPNRGDCLNIYGIARELASQSIGKLRTIDLPSLPNPTVKAPEIEVSSKFCNRFYSRIIKNVNNNVDIPQWLKNRLNAVGIRTISPVVDITNYVMFTLGRPLHAYDMAKVKLPMTVRMANMNETFAALDGKEYILDDKVQVIADKRTALCLAGVIGGSETGCERDSTEIVLEAAHFSPESVLYTGRKYNIQTEGRMRFERFVSPYNCIEALDMTTHLILDICGGELSDVTIYEAKLPDIEPIKVEKTLIESYIPIKLDSEQVIEYLKRLGIESHDNDKFFTVIPPKWRGDIAIPHDIIEELVRIIGIDHIPMQHLSNFKPLEPILGDNMYSATVARNILATRGLQEVVTWSFMERGLAELFTRKNIELAELLNPISSDLSIMRPSIIPNLLLAAKRNFDQNQKDIAMYEIGTIFAKPEPLAQLTSVTGIRTGNRIPRNCHGSMRQVDIFDVKADIMAILSTFSVKDFDLVTSELSYLHPHKSSAIKLQKTGEVIGYLGAIHPNILKLLDIDFAVTVFELFISSLPSINVKPYKGPLHKSKFPNSIRDFAFVLDKKHTAQDVIAVIKGCHTEYIVDIDIFDIYHGTPIDKGQYSMAVAITMQSMKHTLSEEEISNISQLIISNMNEKLGAVLRA